jgi:two-component sensor histidine kinase
MYGYSKEEMLDLTVRDIVPESVRRELPDIIGNGLNEGGFSLETFNMRKDGSVFPVDVNTRVVDFGDGEKVVVYVKDITERKRAEDKIKESLREKEVLLKEIHHRVKNNLQIISSLLNLQAGHVTDEGLLATFRESQNRIKAMSLVHESLYKSDDLSRINFAEYIRTLVRRSFYTYGVSAGNISLEENIAEVYLDIDTSITVALIINELVSNTVKHAFPGGKTGKLKIDFGIENGGMYLLKVSDNGVGLPKGFDPEEEESLGIGLVNALVKQLGADINIVGRKGTTVIISFAVDEGGTDG